MSSPVVTPRMRALLELLRQAQERRGLSTRQLAQKINVAPSTLSRQALDRVLPEFPQIRRMVEVLEPEEDTRDAILDLVADLESSAADKDDWLTAGLTSAQAAGVHDCEKTARKITEWGPLTIPGPLQTGDYARSILSRGKLTPGEIDRRVALRLARRDAVLRRTNPIAFTALIAEAALRTQVGGTETMLDQLHDLLTVATNRDSVTIRVVPTGTDWHPGFSGSFVLFQFPGAIPSIVYHEIPLVTTFVANSETTAYYENDVVGAINQVAKSPDESLEFIDSILTNLKETIKSA